MAVAAPGGRTTEDAIVQLLEGREMDIADLIREVSKEGVPGPDRIKSAVWSLISESAIELTPDYKVRKTLRAQP